MAIRTWQGDETSLWTTAGNWDTGVPVDGDRVVMDNAANCTLDADQIDIELDGLYMEGYTGIFAMGSNNLDVDGQCNLDGTITASAATIECSGPFVKVTGMTALPSGLTIKLNGTGIVVCNAVTGGTVIIDTAGTHTATAPGFWNTFTGTDGTFVCGVHTQTIAGNISFGAAFTLTTGTAIWVMSEDGTISNAGAERMYIFSIAGGKTATTAGSVGIYMQELGGTGNIAGTMPIQFNTTANNNFWGHTVGTVAVEVMYSAWNAGAKASGGAITLEGKLLTIRTTLNHTLTFDENVDLKGGAGSPGSFFVAAMDEASTVVLAANLYCNNLVVGNHATNACTLDLGNGTHTVLGGIRDSATAGTGYGLDVGQSDITLTGTFDGDGITITGEATDGGHCVVHGGTVQNVGLPLDDDALDCTDEATDGGSNTNVWFSGVNGGHQILGGGLIGSAEAA